MQISPVNLVYKPSYTDRGNAYKRSNLGKTAMVTATTASVISSAVKNGSKEQKANLKTGSALVALALMVGTFIDAITNKVSSTITDNKFMQIQEMKKQNSASQDTSMSYHQG